MSNNICLHFCFEEWILNASSRPGWKLISDFVKSITEMQLPFHSWIFMWSGEKNRYVNINKFDSNDAIAFSCAINDYIKMDSIGFIKTDNEIPINALLQNYSIVSSGIIKDTGKSEVFPALVDIDDWVKIEGDEILLVIHHDGEPLFLLRKEFSKKN